MRFTETFRVQKPTEAVLAYAGDFRNLPEWDPSITAVEKLSAGEVGVGSTFRVHLNFLGFASTMEYVVEAWEPGKRARLRGTTPVATAIDTISVAPSGKGTSVTWDADIRFVFPLSLLDVVFAAAFRSTAMDAVKGLRRVLGRMPAEPSSAPA